MRAISRRTGVAVAIGLWAVLPLAAASAGPVTMVLRVDASKVPGDPSAALTQGLMDAASAEGLSPRRADASLAEAASLLDCSASDRTCLDNIASTMQASAFVAASAGAPSGANLPVHLVYFRHGEAPVTRDVLVPAGNPAPALEEKARDLLRGRVGDGGAVPTAAPPAAVGASTGAAPANPGASGAIGGTATVAATGSGRDGGRFSLRRPRPYAWAVAGTGVVLLGAGTFFAIKASGLRDDAAAAPRNTVADLEHLQEIESDGRRATSMSSGLFIAGTVALAAGAGLIVWQGLAAPAEREATAWVAPTALPGGAGVLVRVEVP